jgi:alpha-1,2-mannosyltransferase
MLATGGVWKLRSWGTWLSALAGIVFVTANAVNALNKGGDFAAFLDSGRRLLAGLPLYQDSGVAFGIVGPPFQSVVFAPFALLAGASVPASRLLWYALNLCAFAVGIRLWEGAVSGRAPCENGESRRGFGAWSDLATRRPVRLSVLAIIFALQSNFEQQNVNAVLLCLIGASAWASHHGHERQAGLWAGVAAAFKVFPGLLLVQFAAQRRWRALASGVLVSLGLTALPLARYGSSWVDQILGWWRVSGSGGWPIRGHNQSLFAMAGRWCDPDGMQSAAGLSVRESPETYLVYGLAVSVVIGIVGWAVARGRPAADVTGEHAALTTGAAVLVSPIAWDHYWVLFYPLFRLGFGTGGPSARRRTRTATAMVAALLTSAPMFMPGSAWRVSRRLSDKTIAGLLLILSSAWPGRGGDSSRPAVREDKTTRGRRRRTT